MAVKRKDKLTSQPKRVTKNEIKAPSSYPDICRRFKKWRAESGMTFKELGESMGVPGATLQTYAQGVVAPSFHVMRFLKKKYGVPYEYLIDGEGPSDSGFKIKKGLTPTDISAIIIKLEAALKVLKDKNVL